MIFYNVSLRIFHFFVWMYSFVNTKAKLFVAGRRNSFSKLNEFARLRTEEEELYWFHCASLGEFEQARPLIESIKSTTPNLQVAVSFFSPSGYEIQKNYAFADLVFYLPMATKNNAIKVLKLLQPKKIFFIKYEFWLNYVSEAHRSGIATYLVSALFRPQQIFFQWYGKLFFNVLHKYAKIFVQDVPSMHLLKKYDIHSLVTGDTRFDRVLAHKEKAKKNMLIEKFTESKKIIVLGSSWPHEEELIFRTYNAELNYKIIIAPHDISRSIAVPESFTSIKYSGANEENVSSCNILIIDNIGMLASLYSYATIAFVGGGYRGSLHNILEPAVFGIPVLYGYQTQKHPEAEALENKGGGFIIKNEQHLKTVLRQLLTDENQILIMGNNARKYIEDNAGAAQKILAEI